MTGIWIILGVFGLLAILVLIASLGSSAAAYNQAQANIEVAKVAQEAARGQASTSVANTILVILVIVLVIAVIYLIWRIQRSQAALTEIKQLLDDGQVSVTGYQRLGPGGRQVSVSPYTRSQAALPASQADPVQTMVNLKILELLQSNQQQPAAPQPPNQPAQTTNTSQGDDTAWWKGLNL